MLSVVDASSSDDQEDEVPVSIVTLLFLSILRPLLSSVILLGVYSRRFFVFSRSRHARSARRSSRSRLV